MPQTWEPFFPFYSFDYGPVGSHPSRDMEDLLLSLVYLVHDLRKPCSKECDSAVSTIQRTWSLIWPWIHAFLRLAIVQTGNRATSSGLQLQQKILDLFNDVF